MELPSCCGVSRIHHGRQPERFDDNMVACDVCDTVTWYHYKCVDFAPHQTHLLVRNVNNFFLCFMWGSSSCIISYIFCVLRICGFPILITKITFSYTTLFNIVLGGPHPHQRVPILLVEWGPRVPILPGPHSPGRMGTPGPHSPGSPFSR